MSNFKIERVKGIDEDIILVKGQDYRSLAELFCRFQEHYESTFPEIRGKIFTLGYLKSLTSKKNGAWTYYENSLIEGDWGGYNFPSYVMEPFINGLFDPLTEIEADFVDMFKCKQGKYYIIGVLDDDTGGGSLEHEVLHGLFYLNEAYKNDVLSVLKKYDLRNFKEMLRDWGYCEDVLLDEINAYTCADYEWLHTEHSTRLNKFSVTIQKSMHEALQKVKQKYIPNFAV